MKTKKKWCYDCKFMTPKNKMGRQLYYCRKKFEEIGEKYYLCNIPIIPNWCPKLKKKRGE